MPFEDNSVDEFLLDNVLEHLHGRFNFIMDIRRCLKKGGIVRVRLPSNSNSISHSSYIHNIGYFDCICNNNRSTSMQTKDFFTLENVKRYRNWKNLFIRWYRNIINIFYSEYEWKLKK